MTAHLSAVIARAGPNRLIRAVGDLYYVPRIYLAAHEPDELDIPMLAYEYGWRRVGQKISRHGIRELDL